jgi:hypothetical protein
MRVPPQRVREMERNCGRLEMGVAKFDVVEFRPGQARNMGFTGGLH